MVTIPWLDQELLSGAALEHSWLGEIAEEQQSAPDLELAHRSFLHLRPAREANGDEAPLALWSLGPLASWPFGPLAL